MIGYYVHHQGNGHAHRALALTQALGRPVTGLSSLSAPQGWPGPWVRLERDDRGGPPEDPTARGRLHWAPLGDAGMRRRSHQISAWLDVARPEVVVVDVSVEVALLVRLHGVPVVTVVQPGVRDDPAHVLGYDVADGLVAFWPREATPALLPGASAELLDRVHAVGALARFPVRADRPRRPGSRRVALLAGAGGTDLSRGAIDRAQAATPGWSWSVLSRAHGTWHEDPRSVLEDADVVVTHAGQNAVAEVAAMRRPAIVVPERRPHEEQTTTAAALGAGGWPVLVEGGFPEGGWAERLDRAAGLDGSGWVRWCDGRAAERFARFMDEVGSSRRVAS